MKPLCFVLMPFNRKIDSRGRSIDFDAIYNNMIVPAVSAAGLDVIRADEEQIGGTIHKPMFERLLLCEYAIADVTTANPNVYYELGIRHAMKPRSTVIIFGSGTSLPFDIALLRGMHYQLDDQGQLLNAETGASAISAHLLALQDSASDDSPVFQLLEGLPRPEVDHERTDLFRARAQYSKIFKDRLGVARRDGPDAVRAVVSERSLANLADVEAGVVIDMFLSFRDVDCYADMLSLFERMPEPLKRARMVREQVGFALNRLGRDVDAEAMLNAVIADYGPSSETNGLLGRIYKDRWKAAHSAGDTYNANGQLKRAIDTYLAGFEADWRDPYPGINALTLMQMLPRRDPREAEIAPVVLYAATRRTRSPAANYWDYATVLETAIIAGNLDAAEDALADALPRVEAPWWATTTADTLEMLRSKRTEKDAGADRIAELESALRHTAASMLKNAVKPSSS